MGYYKDIKRMNIDLNQRMKEFVRKAKPVNISNMIFDMTMEYEVSKKSIMERIKEYVKKYSFMRLEGDFLYFDIEKEQPKNDVDSFFDDLKHSEVVQDDKNEI